MEMVAAARLRRAEQRIEALRPYADAIRRMTRQAARGRRQRAAAADPDRARAGQERRSAGRRRRPRTGGRVQLQRRPRRGRRRPRARRRGPCDVYFASGRRPASSLAFRGLEPVAELHRLHRPARVRRRAPDRRAPDGRLRRRRGRPGRDLLQRLHLAAVAGRCAARRCCRCSGRPCSPKTRTKTSAIPGATRESRPRSAGRVRARPGGDPQAAGARLRRDLDLPRAARVDRVRARRADDRDAQRVRERERR